ncbi:mitochondrial pyruvate carrier 2-like [Nannochloropsis oceanica]
MGLSVVPALKARVMAVEFVKNNPRIKAMLDHPAGPFTIHFWAPSFKWGISLANIADFNRPAEFISVPQQLAVTATGIIWSRYSFVITPVNYNLFSVNAFMAVTGSYQLWRKFTTQATPTAPPNSASVSS